MKSATALLVCGVLALGGLSPARALAMSEGVPPPTALRIQPQQAATGDLGLLYTVRLYCEEELCIFPKQVEIERNGETLATADLQLDYSKQQSDYAIFINAKNWKAGDCFRVRLVASAGDNVVGHFIDSAYSNKLCLPTT